MPRNNAERRTRFVSAAEQKGTSRDARTADATGGAATEDGEAAEWEVEVAAAKMEEVTIQLSDGSEAEDEEDSGDVSE